MDDPLRVIIGGLAIIGLFMIAGYFSIRRKPKDERAKLFWGYSHVIIRTGGIVFLVWAVAAFVYQILRDIFK